MGNVCTRIRWPLSDTPWGASLGSIAGQARCHQTDLKTGFTILTDVICSTFPVLIIYKLQMDRRKKIALSFVMSLGLLYV